MNAASTEDALRIQSKVPSGCEYAIARFLPTRTDQSDGDVNAESPVTD